MAASTPDRPESPVRDPWELRESLKLQAMALIVRQTREQIWIAVACAGIAVLVMLSALSLSIELGRFELASPNVVAIAQFGTVAIAAILAILYILGRLRMVRSEMALLRLRLDWVSGDIGDTSEPGAPARPSRGRRIRRHLDPDPLS